MDIALCHLCEFQFLLPLNKYLIDLADAHAPVCYGSTQNTRERLTRRSLPSKNKGRGLWRHHR